MARISTLLAGLGCLLLASTATAAELATGNPKVQSIESISFAFSKIKVSYNPEDDGKLKGFIDKGFDVLTLKPW